MHCSADFFCGKKTLAIILRMLHNEKRKETTQKGMKQPTRTLCAGYPHVGLCFSFAECGGPGPGILPVPDCSGILQPPAQTAGRTARTGDAAVVLYFAAYMGDHGPESQRSVVDHQCGNGTCFGENDPDLSGFARKLRRRSGEPEHNSFIVCVISLGKRP